MPATYTRRSPDESSSSSALTISELTRQIKADLESEYAHVWIEGEIGQFTEARSGHVYLTLKDENARIDGVIWRGVWQNHRGRVPLKVGAKVLALGKVTVYPPRGAYQFIIDRLSDAGAGALEAALRALKARLQAEGLFERGRKKPLPFLPRKVGAVTSATGAARRDIEAVLHRRAPQIPLVLCPARVQGQGAAEDIALALAQLAQVPEVDVIIVGRGGGSMEDLWAFNEEPVVRAIAACPIPVISAVGHETDTTLADLVADFRAPTPSAAAERAVPVRDDLLMEVDALTQRLGHVLSQRLGRSQERLDFLARRLSTGLKVDDRRLAIRDMEARMGRLLSRRLAAQGHQVADLRARLSAQHPRARLARARQALQRAEARLHDLGARPVLAARSDLRVLAGRLNALSPLASLERGYSITRAPTGQVIREPGDAAAGDRIQVLLRAGWLEAEVTGTGEGLPAIEPSGDVERSEDSEE